MFPNAAKGVKRIFTAEILSLIAGVLAVPAFILAVIGAAAAEVDSAGGAIAGLGGASVLLLISGILFIIAAVLELVGIINASKDEAAFKIALYAIIASIVISLVRSIFSSAATLVSICDILLKVAQIVVTVFIIQGVINLAKKVNNEAVAKKGNSLLYIITCIYILSAIASIVVAIFGGYAASFIAGVIAIVGAVLEVVQYVVFLVLLAQAKKMLAQA